MIVLDTNIISELMRARPEPAVVDWLNDQPASSIWTTSICVFEVRLGLGILPEGKRKQTLQTSFEQVLQQDLAGRVLDVDTAAAYAAADIIGQNRPRGINIDFRDVLIAGVVAVRKATLATRNTRHFRDTGINLLDPWSIGAD